MAEPTFDIAKLWTDLGVGGFSALISAVGACVGIAVYVTRAYTQAKIDRLEGDVAREKERHAAELAQLQRRYEDLDARHQEMRRAGSLLYARVLEIETEVARTAGLVDATSHSVLVPAPTAVANEAPTELVFLLLSGPQAHKLKWVRVPIDSSFAGKVFRSGRSEIARRQQQSTGFSSRTDKVADFRTETLLTIPLLRAGRCIGVVQFLNKREDRAFATEDQDRADAFTPNLARLVGELVEDPTALVSLGHAPRRDAIFATILFSDISNFASLHRELDTSVVTDMINQYFQELGSIAIRNGGSLDQFLGDGFMLTFNVNMKIDDHRDRAMRTAVEMMDAFVDLKRRWLAVGYAGVAAIHNRIGIAAGEVKKAEVGHSQMRRVTVMGVAVNTAAHLCDAGTRDQSTIVVDAALIQDLGVGLRAEPLQSGALREPAFVISRA